jgi:hypothetical protein
MSFEWLYKATSKSHGKKLPYYGIVLLFQLYEGPYVHNFLELYFTQFALAMLQVDNEQFSAIFAEQPVRLQHTFTL